MKRISTIIIGITAAALLFTSCNKFLTVEPKTFMSPDKYFNNEAEMQDAVNGLYDALSSAMFNGGVAPNHTSWFMFELITGYHGRTYPTNRKDLAIDLPVLEDNFLVEFQWDYHYTSINNCNNVIKGIETSTANVPESVKNKFLGEAYTLRAYYFFQLVRMFGPVPMPLNPTEGTSAIVVVPSDEATVFDQVVADLTKAEELFAGTAMNPGDGHVGLGAAKSILAKVYLTMAGYPLKRNECYELAYKKAKEVVDSGAYLLFGSYHDFNDPAKENGGEWIMAMQFDRDYAGAAMHGCLLPYTPDDGSLISSNGVFGGAMVPTSQFMASYADGDKRAAEKGYFYSNYNGIEFSRPYIYKFFDPSACGDGKCGQDFPVIRYADILLTMAEAKCAGGSTSDAAAVEAYYQVRHRSVPGEPKPSSISFDQVFKERVWELCYEAQNWFDIVRTRKIMNVAKNTVVDVIGFTPIEHEMAFTERDMYFPYPLAETRLNPNLKR